MGRQLRAPVNSILWRLAWRDEKLQLAHRVITPPVRHLFAQARSGLLSPAAVAREQGLSLSRRYQRLTDDLLACARAHAQTWSPGLSGGDHRPDWPAPVTARLTQLLTSQPPASCRAAASELHRRLHFQTDRASVRRRAIAQWGRRRARSWRLAARPPARFNSRADAPRMIRVGREWGDRTEPIRK